MIRTHVGVVAVLALGRSMPQQTVLALLTNPLFVITLDVVRLTDGFEMVRVTTGLHGASTLFNVVDGESFRNRAE